MISSSVIRKIFVCSFSILSACGNDGKEEKQNPGTDSFLNSDQLPKETTAPSVEAGEKTVVVPFPEVSQFVLTEFHDNESEFVTVRYEVALESAKAVITTVRELFKNGNSEDLSQTVEAFKISDNHREAMRRIFKGATRCHEKPSTDICSEDFLIPYLTIGAKEDSQFSVGSYAECNSPGDFCESERKSNLMKIVSELKGSGSAE